jgi:hypothetical protein
MTTTPQEASAAAYITINEVTVEVLRLLQTGAIQEVLEDIKESIGESDYRITLDGSLRWLFVQLGEERIVTSIHIGEHDGIDKHKLTDKYCVLDDLFCLLDDLLTEDSL